MKIARMACILAVMATASGCYTWVPVEPTAVPVGTEVRAVLTDSGAEGVRQYFGPDVTAVEGPLVSWNREGLRIMAETSVRRAGFMPTVMLDTLVVAQHQLLDLQIQEFSRKRTTWFTVGVVGGTVLAILAVKAFTGGSDEDPGEGGGPPTDDAIVLRIPFSLGIR